LFGPLMQLVKATRVAMLIVTHNMELAGRMDRRVSLAGGKVVELD
jgi:lipoprotein-releasing system ATP-binding protein